jgi:NADH:ubiquinone oxidoreductase subunit D
MSDKDQITLYSFLTDRYEITSDEIEKTFGVVVGKQFNMDTGGVSGPVARGEGGDYAGRRMSDEEYYKRYGHERKVTNFLRERK